ncbi:hypothetical protein [Faecalibacter bovis]|uniref:DUF4320 family protein n=1 Tax=Faecalibacter bovis TaxID=2898187 RepID=A0ABX7XE25_9FLAO|nr:hypothetical protein [Faecalibacter bovis]MBS7333208.1 hypothetical protein [Weeksellaceae bacterium]QTV06138.1 hypothetical protein J9309_02000 [Faecalibacter bovis]
MDFKKGLTATIIVLLIGLGIAIVVGSNQGRDVFFINDFDAIVTNSIPAKKNKEYSFQIVRLKGEVNDTILVKPCETCKVEKLSGQISIKFKNEFHTGTSRFSFEPYKATSGKLKIVHKIR